MGGEKGVYVGGGADIVDVVAGEGFGGREGQAGPDNRVGGERGDEEG